MNPKDRGPEPGRPAGPRGVPSEEVGRGAGMDPQSAPEELDTDAGDEAFANRPSRGGARPDAADSEGAAIQRPPADS
jgi:hypothetical protein